MTEGHVLALDATGRETTLALGVLQGDSVQVVRTLKIPPRRAAAELVQAISAVLDGLPPAALGALVVVRGPGSFTGMRIGLSAAKALAEAVGVPLAGVSRLAVLAGMAGGCRAALDAGRGQVYLRDREGNDRLVSAGEAQDSCGGDETAVCDERLAALPAPVRRMAEPTAADALRHAVGRLQAAAWDDPATLDALYLWPERQMPARQEG